MSGGFDQNDFRRELEALKAQQANLSDKLHDRQAEIMGSLINAVMAVGDFLDGTDPAVQEVRDLARNVADLLRRIDEARDQ
jgi:hypothetical protein